MKAVRLHAQMVFARKKTTEGPKHFRRLCDKKINALAMAAVLTVPDEALPQEITAGLGQLMAGLLKLLTTLRAQQVLSPHAAEPTPEPAYPISNHTEAALVKFSTDHPAGGHIGLAESVLDVLGPGESAACLCILWHLDDA